jgi:hypothetical protein
MKPKICFLEPSVLLWTIAPCVLNSRWQVFAPPETAFLNRVNEVMAQHGRGPILRLGGWVRMGPKAKRIELNLFTLRCWEIVLCFS